MSGHERQSQLSLDDWEARSVGLKLYTLFFLFLFFFFLKFGDATSGFLF